jgi:hypothetical protein
MSEVEKKKRDRPKKKFVQRSNAVCLVLHTQNGGDIPADQAAYIESVVNDLAVEFGLILSVTRS